MMDTYQPGSAGRNLERGIPCINSTGEDMPPHAVFMINEIDVAGIVVAKKPDEDDASAVLFGPTHTVPDGATFFAVSPYDELAAYTNASTLSPGDTIGTESGSWEMSSDQSGFVVVYGLGGAVRCRPFSPLAIMLRASSSTAITQLRYEQIFPGQLPTFPVTVTSHEYVLDEVLDLSDLGPIFDVGRYFFSVHGVTAESAYVPSCWAVSSGGFQRPEIRYYVVPILEDGTELTPYYYLTNYITAAGPRIPDVPSVNVSTFASNNIASHWQNNFLTSIVVRGFKVVLVLEDGNYDGSKPWSVIGTFANSFSVLQPVKLALTVERAGI